MFHLNRLIVSTGGLSTFNTSLWMRSRAKVKKVYFPQGEDTAEEERHPIRTKNESAPHRYAKLLLHATGKSKKQNKKTLSLDMEDTGVV